MQKPLSAVWNSSKISIFYQDPMSRFSNLILIAMNRFFYLPFKVKQMNINMGAWEKY